MLNTLLESKARPLRNTRGALASAVLHTAVIAAAAYATASGTPVAREPEDPTTVRWVTPAPASRRADPTVTHSANASAATTLVPRPLVIPVDITAGIPAIKVPQVPVGPDDFVRTSAGNGDPDPTSRGNANSYREGLRAYNPSEVESAAAAIDGTIRPEYPPALRSLGIEGQVVAQFVVNEDGHAEPKSFRTLSSTNEVFAEAVRRSLLRMRFHPARLGGKPVPQLVQQLFVFRLDR